MRAALFKAAIYPGEYRGERRLPSTGGAGDCKVLLWRNCVKGKAALFYGASREAEETE